MDDLQLNQEIQRNMLVVISDKTLIVDIEGILKEKDIAFDLVPDEDEAWQYLYLYNYQIILYDGQVSQDAGSSFCQALREDERTTVIPLLFLYGREVNIAELSELFAFQKTDFVYKPLIPLELLNRLSTFIALKNAENQIEEQQYQIEELKVDLEGERKKTQHLLKNFLPEKVVDDLREGARLQIEYFPSASIMFTDFKEFSNACRKLSPEQLVQTLETYFSNFDSIIDQYRIEKIKTVGDAYMCASGLPEKNESHAIELVIAGLEICSYVRNIKSDYADQEKFLWDVRVGINTGDLIAGVIGKSKFSYDVWGNTVNKASRVEEGSDLNCVTVSASTYKQIAPYFDCWSRGEVTVKNHEKILLYQVDRIKEPYSDDEQGLFPNEKLIKIMRK